MRKQCYPTNFLTYIYILDHLPPVIEYGANSTPGGLPSPGLSSPVQSDTPEFFPLLYVHSPHCFE